MKSVLTEGRMQPWELTTRCSVAACGSGRALLGHCCPQRVPLWPTNGVADQSSKAFPFANCSLFCRHSFP